MRPALLFFHIGGGTIGLLSGTVAMAVRKGGALHRLAGNVFTVAMLVLAASGLSLAIAKSQRGNMVGSVVTFYLIGTAWLAGQRGGGTRWIDWAAMVWGLLGGMAAIALGVYTIRNPAFADPSAPAGMSIFFGTILLLAVAGDIRMLARDGIAGRARVLRHLWRMCFGLFIATGSFFLGQQQVFPQRLRGSVYLTVLGVLPLALLIYWVWRVRFGKGSRQVLAV